jgi:putative metallohydrolase (TIGR04338 family)
VSLDLLEDLMRFNPAPRTTVKKRGRNVREGIRDTQRSRLYKAERESGLEKHVQTMTIAEAQRFVDRLLAQKTVRKRFPFAMGRITVVAGRGCHAQWYGRRVTLAKWGCNPLVICHEVAHILERRGAAHGWEFAETELWLVRRAMGQEAHDALKAAFKAHRVRSTKPRERKPLSEEQKAVLRERLVAARAKKAAA